VLFLRASAVFGAHLSLASSRKNGREVYIYSFTTVASIWLEVSQTLILEGPEPPDHTVLWPWLMHNSSHITGQVKYWA
jgi:hypothetical protein